MNTNFDQHSSRDDLDGRKNVSVEEHTAAPALTTDRDDLREEAVFPSDRSLNKFTLYRRRFLRNKGAILGSVILLLLVALAVIGPLLAKYDYRDPDFMSLAVPPGPDHWFGTDSTGMDLYAQTVHGLGRSLTIALTVSVVTTIISGLIGAFAAFWGGWAEKTILAIIHFLLVVPSFLVLALLVQSTSGNWIMLIFALILFGWMYYARVIWSLAIGIREREYIHAARFMGVPGWRIVVRHIIPNIGSLLIVNLTLGVVSTVMSETGLSFLGLGIKLPDVSLGTLLNDGVNTLESSPWLFFFPAGVLTLLTVSMALIADGLRDALDPNSASGGKVK